MRCIPARSPGDRQSEHESLPRKDCPGNFPSVLAAELKHEWDRDTRQKDPEPRSCVEQPQQECALRRIVLCDARRENAAGDEGKPAAEAGNPTRRVEQDWLLR